jgi:hypothetical protein
VVVAVQEPSDLPDYPLEQAAQAVQVAPQASPEHPSPMQEAEEEAEASPAPTVEVVAEETGHGQERRQTEPQI